MLLDTVQQAVIATDRDGLVTYWNRHAQTLYGWTADEVLGRQVASIVPSEESAEAARAIMAALDAGGMWEGDFEARRRDGTTFTAHVTDSPIVVDGEQVGIVGISMDVSEERRVAQALRESEERFRQVFENAPTGIAITDLDGRFEDANPAYRRITGRSPEELRASRVVDLLHPDDRAENAHLLAQLGAGEIGSFELENRYVRGDGAVIWAHKLVAALRDARGAPMRLVGLVTDVTAQRRSADALRDSEQRFRTMADTLPLLVWMQDRRGRQEWVNQTFCRLFGVPRESMREHAWERLLHPEDAEAYRDAFTAAVEQRAHFHAETRVRIQDGSWRWLESWGQPRFAADGEYLGHVGTSADVTERKAWELGLQANEERERRGRRRAELLASVVGELETADGLRARCSTLVELLVPRIADYASVELPEAEEPVLAVKHHEPARHAALVELRRAHRLELDDANSTGRVARGEEQLLELTPERILEHCRTPETAALLDRLGPRSHLAVPIDLGGGRRGALLLGLTDPARRPYSRDDLAFVRELAGGAATVMGAAYVREESRRISLRLQEALLPAGVLRHDELEIAARYSAASELLEVGGDFYDAFELPTGKVAIVVGDVVGHGLEAAASMGRVRTALAALAQQTDSPGLLLSQVDAFAEAAGDIDFATIACAIVDPFAGTLTHASAGHPPILLLEPTGAARWLEDGRSAPIGVRVGATRPEATTVLQPGAAIVLCSDGLLERRGESIDRGLARLRATALDATELAPGELCDRLLARLDAARSDDDVVVVVARYLQRDHTRRRLLLPAEAGTLGPSARPSTPGSPMPASSRCPTCSLRSARPAPTRSSTPTRTVEARSRSCSTSRSTPFAPAFATSAAGARRARSGSRTRSRDHPGARPGPLGPQRPARDDARLPDRHRGGAADRSCRPSR
ncbi:MAG: PAS domain S-box protein [Thermoleophilia bacterium]